MAFKDYGVFRGQVIEGARESDTGSPHYQVHIAAGDLHYRIAVNVQSLSKPSELLFLVEENFQHPILSSVISLPIAFTSLPSKPESCSLDFIRGNLFSRAAMRLLPADLPGQDNDLNDKFEHYVSRAKMDPLAEIWAFGERWGPDAVQDEIFHFAPGNGVHDIHMNQGNDSRYAKDDGVWQDGGLIFRFPSLNQWVAVFLAFQSQAWHTDDLTGHALVEAPVDGPGNIPSPAEPDNIVQIVGAMVNPSGPGPESESVILLNISPDPIDLNGWAIADKVKNKCELSGIIPAGSTLAVPVKPPAQFSNKGGIITLLDKTGLKVNGVSYTAEQAGREGWVIKF